MPKTEEQQLWEYQIQLRRIAAHREAGAEAAIRREYQRILSKLQTLLAKYYAAYGNADDSTMSQGDLRAAGQYKNFLQDVVDNLGGIAEPVDKQIRQIIEDTYIACYDGMVNAVKQSVAGNITLQSALSGLSATTPETVKNVVENPMDKLKLSTVLNRRRSQVVSSTKKTLAVGLANGDSYTRMAQRIAETLNGDYKKAMRIVRTEANRAINRGFQDVTEEASDLLLGSDYVEVKEWCSMKDESVRDTHQHLNSKKIHALDTFTSKSGAKATCPGAFGVAAEDINCRCFLNYSFMSRAEFLAQGGVIPDAVLKNEAIFRKNVEVKGNFNETTVIPEDIKHEILCSIEKLQNEFDVQVDVFSFEEIPDSKGTPFQFQPMNARGKFKSKLVINSLFNWEKDLDSLNKRIYNRNYKRNILAPKNVRNLIEHEMAHFMSFQDCDTYLDFRMREGKLRMMFVAGVSGYADACCDGSEVLAEGFVRMINGERVDDKVKLLIQEYIERWRKNASNNT